MAEPEPMPTQDAIAELRVLERWLKPVARIGEVLHAAAAAENRRRDAEAELAKAQARVITAEEQLASLGAEYETRRLEHVERERQARERADAEASDAAATIATLQEKVVAERKAADDDIAAIRREVAKEKAELDQEIEEHETAASVRHKEIQESIDVLTAQRDALQADVDALRKKHGITE